MRVANSLAMIALWACPALVEAQPDISELLNKVKETYSTLNGRAFQYEVEETVTQRDPATGRVESFSLRLAVRHPDPLLQSPDSPAGKRDQYRLVMKGDFGEPGIDEIQMISDGTKSWQWSPRSNQYRLYDAKDRVPDSVNPTVIDDEFGVWRFGFITSWGRESKFLREDHLIFSGQPTDCWVIETPGPQGGQVWIDKSLYYVLRLVSPGGATTDYKMLKLNQTVADDLFEFEPPANAKRVADGVPFSK